MLLVLLVLSVTVTIYAVNPKVCCIQNLVGGGTACVSNFPEPLCPASGLGNAFGDPKHRNCCKTKLATCTQFFTYINGTAVASTCGGHIKVPTSDQTDKK